MRIVLASDYIYPLGGAENHVFGLASLLEEAGHEVRLFGTQSPPGKTVLATRIYDPRWSFKLKRLIEEFRPHLLHVHNFSYVLSPSIMVAANRAGVPVVLTVHDAHLLCPRTWLVDRHGIPCGRGMGPHCFFGLCAYRPYFLYVHLKLLLHNRFVDRHVTRIIAPSRFLHALLAKRFGWEKLAHIPYFSNLKGVSSPFIPHNGTILYCGKLVPEKGVDVLIKALPDIAEVVGRHVRLLLVGEGPEKHKLIRLASHLGVEEMVEFLGSVPHEEVTEYYKRSRVVCVPSLWQENFPLVAIEAYLHQRPIVASRIGGLPEMVREGVTGFLFRPGDPRDLAEKVVALLTDDALALRMSQNMGHWRPFLEPDEYRERLIAVYASSLR